MRSAGAASKLAGSTLALLAAMGASVGGCSSGRPNNRRDVARLIAESPPPPSQQFQPIQAEERLALLEQGESGPYHLGIGDVVEITENTKTLAAAGLSGVGTIRVRVQQDGNIYLPELGSLPAKDQTVVALQGTLLEKLSTFSAKPFVSVDVVEYKAQKYYLLGEIQGAGVHQVDGTTTLLDALSKGGGAAKSGDLDAGHVIRDGKILPIGLSDLLVRGDLSRNIVMRDKDIVYVPSLEDKKVFVVGEVKSPMAVMMPKGRMSLVAAITAAGGLRDDSADPNVVRIFRGSWTDLKCYTLSACELYKAGESIQVLPGDRILVAPYGLATASRALGLVTPIIGGISNSILTPLLIYDTIKN